MNKSVSRLHKLSVKQASKHAIAIGWDKLTVTEIVNLEHSIASINRLAKANKANKQQLQALLDLHDAVKLEFAGKFYRSQH